MNYDHSVVLKFENAGIFQKSWKNQNGKIISRNKDDRVLTNKSREFRTKDQWLDMNSGTIHYTFIDNVLRVFFGKRPVAKYRPTCVSGDSDITNIAKRSFVQINSLTYKNKEGKEFFVSEKMTTRKALDNSWNQCSPSWVKMKYLLTPELYAELVDVASDICQSNVTREVLTSVCDKLHESKDSRVADLIKKARAERAEPLAKLLTGDRVHSLQQAGFRGLGAYLKTLVTKGVCDIARIDGFIGVPIFNNELNQFMEGNGLATILEGGVVTIHEVIDLKYTTIDMVFSDFTPAGQ